MKKILAALMATVAVVLLPMAAGAAPASARAGAAYGDHVSGHAAEGGFSGTMNPGAHRGFAGFSEHH
jgi:hypothetical protein